MNTLAKIIKYSFYDTLRSWWALLYGLFFLVLASTLLYFSGDFTRALVSLLNVVLLLVPLISTVFGTMYFITPGNFQNSCWHNPSSAATCFWVNI